jgi:asparagine synthase (glutamine-hydrolysing)
MCGFVAMFCDAGGVTASQLRACVDTLAHRGPDERGDWVSPDRRVGLAHARLSIIDLTTGQQPLANEDERVHMVVNGEFYDYRRIRSELAARGHVLRSTSDSEIAVHLYEELGAQCLEQLRGEFAFVLWDERNRRLFAARDRFGIKPLFYAVHDGTLILASEIKALLAAGVPARWDTEALFQQLADGMAPHADRTLFHGIHQVPPGHYLLAGEHGLRLVQYWDFDYPREHERTNDRSDEQHIEAFRAALDDAVRMRLQADVPVGCYLSGGIDSCSVLGLAARHASKPVRAFTIGFEVALFDESAIAREMAAHCGAEFQHVQVQQRDLADNFAAAVRHAETLLINPHGIAKFLLSRAVRDAGLKVVLTGEGADEVLGGYPFFHRDFMIHEAARENDGDTRRKLEELAQSSPLLGTLFTLDESLGPASVRRRLGYMPAWALLQQLRLRPALAVLSPDLAQALAARSMADELLDELPVSAQLTGRHPLHQSMYVWSKQSLPSYILSVLGDRMEMAHSIEGRLPFLDHPLVELVRDMPATIKIRGMTEKYLLREALEPVLTKTAYERRKHPFLAPPYSSNLQGPMATCMQDLLRSEAMRAVPLFEHQRVIALLDKLPTLPPHMHLPVDGTLMMLASSCLLQQHFGL